MLADLIVFAKKVAKSIQREFPCKKVGMTVIGLEVPHAHIHLIPINNLSDMDFSQPKLTLSHDELVDIASQLAI